MAEVFTLRNTSPGERTIYDDMHRAITFAPGETRKISLSEKAAESALLWRRDDLVVIDELDEFIAKATVGMASQPSDLSALVVIGMQGLGDNLHQRAIIRELMKTNDVTLATCWGSLYHDLVARGLKLAHRRSQLRTQAKTQAREIAMLRGTLPKGARSVTIWPRGVQAAGSILGAMFASVGLAMPERPDFSLPVPREWRKALRARLPATAAGKPIMVHRPIVLRREWDGRSRNPDLAAYDALYRSIRERFFVVSVADIEPGQEWVDGPPYQEVDLVWHRGELHFPHLAALWAEAALVFSSAGFAPILAQSVGTPSVTIYGGRESSRTTNWVGAHLAPTLMIDPDRPCDCHSHHHHCQKAISLGPAVKRLQAFVKGVLESAPMPELPIPVPAQKPLSRPSIAARKPVSAAIVVGGAAAAMDEFMTAWKLCEKAGVWPTVVVVNDMIALMHGEVIAATLHPHQLPGWLAQREANGFPKPLEVWGYYRGPLVSHLTGDWQGSGGLFGVCVALQRRHDRIICAGIPMEPGGGHIVRKRDWDDCHRYRKGWLEHLPQIAECVRSMSGWTAAQLGEPDVRWITS